MGIFMDTIEDNYEKVGQFYDQSENVFTKESSRFVINSKTKTPIIECPICGEVTISREEFSRHLLQRHANLHAYIRTDKYIIRNMKFIQEMPKDFCVILLGADSATITVDITGKETIRDKFSHEFSLNKYLRGFSSGEINVELTTSGGFKHSFHIYVGEMPNLENKPIDKEALRFLFLPLNQHEVPNFSGFSERFFVPDSNIMEYKYASGLFEYVLGFQMIRDNQEGKKHIEESFGNLSLFNTPFAVIACRVLSLRMNCFNLLRTCSENSRFYVAHLFFNDPDARINIPDNFSYSKWQSQEYGVYIDDFTELFLDALNSYYSSDFDVLREIILKIENEILDTDKNNRDKLTLLQARMAEKMNGRESSLKIYELLRDHPDFGLESKEILS